MCKPLELIGSQATDMTMCHRHVKRHFRLTIGLFSFNVKAFYHQLCMRCNSTGILAH